MPRKRLPEVGVRDLGTSRLSPRVRRILKRRAKGASRRANAPVIRAARQGVNAVNRGYREEKQSIRGATRMAQGTLADALAGLGSSGLKGGARKQVAAELKSRSRDVSRSIPFLLADAASQRREDVTEARQVLIDALATRDKDTATEFNSLLDEARTDAESAVKTRRKEKAEGKLSDSDKRKIKNARIALNDFLRQWGKDAELRKDNRLKSAADWQKLALTLVEGPYSGFDAAAAMQAIRQLRRSKQRETQRFKRKGGTRRFEPWEKAGRPFNAG